jgi:FeS assembly SUF system protein
MGIFSFLSSKSAASENGRDSADASTVADAIDAAAIPAPGPTPEAQPLPADDWAAPFVATDIDTGALTKPVEESPTIGPAVGPADAALTAELQAKIIEVIKTVYDPEIPVDIYELGLVYEIIVDAQKQALVRMTLTSPACPSAQQIPSEVRYKVKALPELTDASVEIVWEPPWDKDRMSETAKLQLGFF